ncbi:RxLR-like protein [Plasmopara halstedii]|uniref:Secreted RxLR effector protein RXLR-C251 n=1 Tax=Plasmopara halstedii TaxID=4781 RepID=RLR25_PLAHL|nr:RxLR-like protein [Plasmopara halstedii]A0A0P1B8W9.1 RecName: Full=Secreted RxLR effector protein RXLR-C251; Flags: Precursor [Plasmopara halstedii]CEG50476.1 RxLR-like protein [Plasmopara halstedii]|eukprot:XP_024586845.1 RxLR-like protein [Plasmopara halstedii]
MRFFYKLALMTTVASLACSDTALASTDLMPFNVAETQVSTHDIVSAGRSLRAEDTSTSIDNLRDPTMKEKIQFKLWYTRGKTPGQVHRDFFEGLDESIIVNNPNYEVWKMYEAYYNNKKGND